MPTFTDKADGSGIEIDTSFEMTSNVTIYRFTGDALGTLTPVYGPTALANSVVTAAVPKGFYACSWYDPTAFGRSGPDPVFVVQVTDGRDAVASQIRDALKARIGLLDLPNCKEIAIQMTPDESNLKYPCVVITPADLQETDEQALSTLDDRGHPNRIMICFREDALDHAVLKLTDFWRERIVRALHNQQMPNPREVVRMRVEYDYILNPNLPQYQYMVSEFVARVTTREPRGVGA